MTDPERHYLKSNSSGTAGGSYRQRLRLGYQFLHAAPCVKAAQRHSAEGTRIKPIIAEPNRVSMPRCQSARAFIAIWLKAAFGFGIAAARSDNEVWR